MATLAMRAPEKGHRQAAAATDENVDLRTAAAAHYLSTDHETEAGRLVQGQVDHALLVGHRVRSSPEEILALEREFANEAAGACQLGVCPACQRGVSHGEFGVDHIAYVRRADASLMNRGDAAAV